MNIRLFVVYRVANNDAHALSSTPHPRSAFALSLLARPQAMGDLMYEADNRIFFQQAEPPVQYTNNLTLVCELPENVKEKEVKEVIKHVWITDKGEAKMVELP